MKQSSSAFRSFALGAMALMLVLFTLFAVQVFRYYRGIKSGNYAALPQFTARLTIANGKSQKANGQASLATLGAEDDPALGPAAAKLTIIQFADFECPFSREAFTTVRTLAAEYGDRVKFVFRDMPLDELHSHARAASVAADCASAQGKFWQMHDKLFQNSDKLTNPDLRSYAEQIGLDLGAYDACVKDPGVAAEVEADLKAGEAAGVRGTPTFFFNGRKVEGAIPPAIFKELIERLLAA